MTVLQPFQKILTSQSKPMELLYLLQNLLDLGYRLLSQLRLWWCSLRHNQSFRVTQNACKRLDNCA